MAMETESAKSDFAAFMNKVREWLFRIFRWIYQLIIRPVIRQIEKVTGRKIGQARLNRKDQKKKPLKRLALHTKKSLLKIYHMMKYQSFQTKLLMTK